MGWGSSFLPGGPFLFLNHSRDARTAGHEQGLHVSAARQLRVRWLETLTQFSLQHQRAREKKSVFQIISPAERSIEKSIAEIGPLGFVLATERRMVRVCCRDD